MKIEMFFYVMVNDSAVSHSKFNQVYTISIQSVQFTA